MSHESKAIVSPVPANFRGKVLTRGNLSIAIALFTFQFLLALCCTLLPAIVGGLAATGQLLPNLDLGFLPVLVGLGVSGLVGWIVMGWVLKHPWSSRYMFYKTRTEFLRRRDAIVDPNNPEAILVEVIPRRNWGQISLQSAEDQGLLFLDSQRRQLLFEGDNKRYLIPVQAVISSVVEMINGEWESDERRTPVAAVAVTFRDSEGLARELPLRPMRAVSGDPLGGNYVERAEELQRRRLNLSS